MPVIYSSVFFDLMMCDNKMICIGLSDIMNERTPRTKKRYHTSKKRPHKNSPRYHQNKGGVEHGRKIT